jgi:hypothetical protein
VRCQRHLWMVRGRSQRVQNRDGSLPTRRPAGAQILRKQPKQPDLLWIVSYWGRTPAKDLPGVTYARDEEAAKDRAIAKRKATPDQRWKLVARRVLIGIGMM